MTAVLSGTNGLLQSYDYQVLTTGFSYTFAAGTQVLVINPAGTLATGTITMPAAPADGMTITFSSSQIITALTIAGNGASIVSAVTTLPAGGGATYIYRATGTTWYPTATVPGAGSQLVSGTAQTAPPATPEYFDFTGIPSWVKRVTVMFNGVSTNGTSQIIVQLGDAGGVETTGYQSSSSNTADVVTSTAGIVFCDGSATAAATLYTGVLTFVLITTNTWVADGSGGSTANNGSISGGKTLSGTLDRVRITTAGGVNTFDAGTVNILYE
jgi:hypothetical protein